MAYGEVAAVGHVGDLVALDVGLHEPLDVPLVVELGAAHIDGLVAEERLLHAALPGNGHYK
jgi:hypothetical protein